MPQPSGSVVLAEGLFDTGTNMLTDAGNLAVLAVGVAIVIALLVVIIITKLSAKAIIATILVGGIALWGATAGVGFFKTQTAKTVKESSTGDAPTADFTTK